MMDNGVNTSTTKNIRLHKRGEQRVYDLDVMPNEDALDQSYFAVSGNDQTLRPDAEVPEGMTLRGYDRVDDAVAELANASHAASGECLNQPLIKIELPTKAVLGGETGYGTIALCEASAFETIIYFYSDNTTIAHAPEMVVIPAGETKFAFPVATSNPGRATCKVGIMAMLPGDLLFSDTVSVRYNLGFKVR